jgi:alkylation response protein AidB-like acyl-CoA dehydrogenase
MDALLFHILTSAVRQEPVVELLSWWPRMQAASAGLRTPIERAVAAGFAADRLGYAFAAGYQEALHQLVPTLGPLRAALCATEVGGVHPRAIATQLTAGAAGMRLSGQKSWVTLGTHAEALLVVASEGADSHGRNRLCVCQVPRTRQGVTLGAQPPTPFAPEIPHATLHLHEVPVEPHERLAGDGYERYLKPFRTIEDLHVHAALLGYLLGVARRAGWPAACQEELAALIITARALAAMPPEDPTLHVALAGLLSSCERLVRAVEPLWQEAEPAERTRWERDCPLLAVAGKARAQRLAAAWERLHALAPAPAAPSGSTA